MTAAAPRRSWVEQIMGLPVSVLARGPSARSPEADLAVQELFAELTDVDATFSPYRSDSDVSRLRRGAVVLADCPTVVREVAARCAHLSEQTGGLFDATTPDGSWDPSGFVKGWATQRALRVLADVDRVDWCLNAGGDVAVLCRSEVGFVVGIQDPLRGDRVATTVEVRSGGVATSGCSARGAHLYDPRTGRPAASVWASMTVKGPELEVADVLATAAFVAGDDWLEVVAAMPGYTALGIDLSGTLCPGSGWSAH